MALLSWSFVRIQQILRAHRIPTNSAELMQVEALPREWRCHMLASLYIVRSDETLSRVNPVTDFDLWIVDEMCAPGHLVTDNPRKLLRNHKKQWERIVLFHRVVGILHVLWHTLHLYRLEEQRRETSVWPSVESGCAEHASNSQRAAAHTDDTLDRPPAAGLLPHLQVLEISDHDQHDQ